MHANTTHWLIRWPVASALAGGLAFCALAIATLVLPSERSLAALAGQATVIDGDTLELDGIEFGVVHTPGHTLGSTCYIADGRLLTGDTLFIRAIGRTDLPGGDAATMHESLANILRPLDDNLILCPGHNYAETPTAALGKEKKDNPFLACSNRDQFLRMLGLA